MVRAKAGSKPKKSTRMWDTDPRVQKLLAQAPGGRMDLSVFSKEELGQLVLETQGSMPDLPDPPKVEYFA